jgi:preprotein translocase subunit SecE
MARKPKPPGKEKWTWDEIHMGRKLSRSDKFVVKMARVIEESKDSSGKIVHPKGHEAKNLLTIYAALLIIIIFIGVIQFIIFLSR